MDPEQFDIFINTINKIGEYSWVEGMLVPFGSALIGAIAAYTVAKRSMLSTEKLQKQQKINELKIQSAERVLYTGTLVNTSMMNMIDLGSLKANRMINDREKIDLKFEILKNFSQPQKYLIDLYEALNLYRIYDREKERYNKFKDNLSKLYNVCNGESMGFSSTHAHDVFNLCQTDVKHYDKEIRKYYNSLINSMK